MDQKESITMVQICHLPEGSKNVRLVISECKGLNGQLEGECGENGEGEEVSKHQVAILVATEDVVFGGNEAGYPVAGCLTHLGEFFQKSFFVVFGIIRSYMAL